MQRLCDLHTHSYYSDGTYSPSMIIDEAISLGLSAVALTDHNTTAGLAEFKEAAQDSDVRAICGVEFSTDFEGRELHVIGLYIDECFYPEIEEKMIQIHRQKDAANRRLVEKLGEMGFDITFEEVEATATGHPNRAHIADVMWKKGYVPSIKEAFARYLDPKLGIYVLPPRPCAIETVKYIKSIGAVPVLAHPYLSFEDEDQLERFLTEAIPEGLAAIEAYYSGYDEATTERALATVRKFNILPSGGSDFHGEKRPGVYLGVGRDNLAIPASVEESLATFSAR